MKLTLLGTTTSPYVRKIRILLRALPVAHELLDTREPQGSVKLQSVAPLGKVPTLITEDRVIPDSSLIAHWLWEQYPSELRQAGFLLDSTDWDDRTAQLVVEGALDAAINRFYLLKDVSDVGYLRKQADRVGTALAWCDAHMVFRQPVGLAALSLGCALDWMQFRGAVDLEPYPRLQQFLADWNASGVGAGTEPG